jgi:hypothetical protein
MQIIQIELAGTGTLTANAVIIPRAGIDPGLWVLENWDLVVSFFETLGRGLGWSRIQLAQGDA